MKAIFRIFIIPFFFLLPELQAQPFHPKFFCFEDAFLKEHTEDPLFQAKLMKDFGFDGMELMDLDRMDERIAALDELNVLEILKINYYPNSLV